tara:strand:+ start:1084 stop:1629 length:546 start_codon:yes stop_codon:yes gene_type:complete
MSNISEQLKAMRVILNQCLEQAEKDIQTNMGIKLSLDIGNIKYGVGVDGNSLGEFSTSLKAKVKGQDKETLYLKNFAKVLKKEKIIDTVSIFDKPIKDRRGDLVQIIGLDIKKPKNCLQLVVNGKKGYTTNLGYLAENFGMYSTLSNLTVKANKEPNVDFKNPKDYLKDLYERKYFDIIGG